VNFRHRAWPPDALTALLHLDLAPWPDAPDDGPVRLWEDDRARMTAVGVALERDERDEDGSVVLTGRCHPSPAAIARAVRFAAQPWLLDAGWLLLHGASVLLDDGVHVFLAPSGTGKSTLARRLVNAGAALLGDEVAMVCERQAGVFPLQPLAGNPVLAAPLAAIHLLGQGAPFSEPLSPTAACAQLLSHAMVYESGPRAMRRSLELATVLARGLPVFATRVPDDERATAHLLRVSRRAA
jgi:hypothetical protein